jgi:beta-galactosidase
VNSPSRPHWLRWPSRPDEPRMAFGADYNPDQWPREVWREDVAAMKEAGVNIVSVAIFSWTALQPSADTWDFEWLDEVMDLMHEHDIAVDLATATASPPAWLTRKHPEILPVSFEGQTVWPGARQQWRPTSPVFRRYALELVRRMAERYGSHPALAAWHVSNELGCHNAHDYSDDAAVAFRRWLRARYGDSVPRLNEAWGTSFWSQRYGDFEEVLPPRFAGHGSFINPTQVLDFQRFSSDALADYLRAERDVLRELTPEVPVTTNFMVMGETRNMDYASWAEDIDFVSNDHYVVDGEHRLDELSFSANLTGNIAGGRPWYLMEHSTSAVQWKAVNLPKRSGELVRDSLVHVGHGADAVCYFQWRQSAAGAEKYHSAMVPHAGRDSALFRTVGELGAKLGHLAPVVGASRRPAAVAVLFDWDSWWASEASGTPSAELRYRREALEWYAALLDLGLRADVVPTSADLGVYDLVIAPVLHVVPDALAARLEAFVDGGGHLVATYFSGIVDENDHVRLGGYPGVLRDLLGIRVEEFGPLAPGDSVALDNGTSGDTWTEPVSVTDPDVEVLARYKEGEYAGQAAVTRRRVGQGSAAYVSTRLGQHGIEPVLRTLAADAGVASELPTEAEGLLELIIRESEEAQYWFLVNRTDGYVDVAAPSGEVLLGRVGGAGSDARLVVPPRGVVVLQRPA